MPKKAPPLAIILGWGGVIPFVASALAFRYAPPHIAITALDAGTIYGALIITFIGAVHWGIALRRDEGHSAFYIWSVVPSLLMVLVLMLAPALRPAPLLAGLILLWGVDLMATRAGVLPGWYMRLRHGLTVVAAASILSLYLSI